MSRLLSWDLNEYFLNQSTVYTALNYNPTGGDVKPFFPAQEEPESGDPFIRYYETYTFGSENYWMNSAFITYEIVSTDLIVAATLGTYFAYFLRSGDSPAARINTWFQNNGYNNFRIKSATMYEYSGADSSKEEGGLRNSIVSFNIDYVTIGALDQLD